MCILEKIQIYWFTNNDKLVLPLQGFVPKRILPLIGISTIDIDNENVKKIKITTYFVHRLSCRLVHHVISHLLLTQGLK
jgi:hypothetical protein